MLAGCGGSDDGGEADDTPAVTDTITGTDTVTETGTAAGTGSSEAGAKVFASAGCGGCHTLAGGLKPRVLDQSDQQPEADSGIGDNDAGNERQGPDQRLAFLGECLEIDPETVGYQPSEGLDEGAELIAQMLSGLCQRLDGSKSRGNLIFCLFVRHLLAGKGPKTRSGLVQLWHPARW